jgi:RND family efflux transporter MFP subunit
MKKLLYIIPLLAITVIVIIKLMSNKKEAQNKIYHYDKEQPIHVLADTLKLQLINTEKFYTGNFDPNKESKISSETQGKINAIYVDAGSYVKRGQSLIKLDDALLRLQLQSVAVQIEGLETDVKRYTILTQADAIQGVQLEKAQLGLKSAKVQRSTLLEQIAKTNIRAPFDGVVTLRLTELGAFAAPGIPLLQVTDISKLRFTINVPENDLPFFKSSMRYPIKADAYPELNLSGNIALIGSKSNAGNLYPVQFSLNNIPGLKIKAGMFGKAFLSHEYPIQGILIPGNAIVGSDIQPQVYVIKKDKANLQNITISKRIGNQALVTDGLHQDDIIVIGGFINLFEGAPVITK